MTALDLPGLATSYRAVSLSRDPGEDRLLTQSRPTTGRRDALSITFSGDVPSERRRVLEYTVQALDRLRSLPSDWDGDGADPITDTACLAAIKFLTVIADADTAAPNVVPLASGGVQLEWLIAGHDLEIELGPDGGAHVLSSDPDGKILMDGPVDGLSDATSYAEVRDRLRRLTFPLHDVG